MSARKMVSANLIITVLTPVHIGDGKKYSRLDRYDDQKQEKIGIINSREWMKYLDKNNLLNDYTYAISNLKHDKGEAIFDNYSMMEKWGRSNLLTTNPELFSIVISTSNMKTRGIKDLFSHIKNVKSEPYIPGSSFKGMLRTAVLIDRIKEAKTDPQQRDKICKLWKTLVEGIERSTRGKEDRIFNSICNQVEENFFEEILDRNGKKLSKQLADPFRGILIGDSEPISKESIILSTKQDYVISAAKNIINTSLFYRESLRPGTVVKMPIALDLNHLEKAGLGFIKSVDDLLRCISSYREMVKDTHDELLEQAAKRMGIDTQYKKAKKKRDDGYVGFLGAGSGFEGHSLIYALAPTNEAAREAVVKLLNKQFETKNKKNIHTIEKDTFASPRTLKVTHIADKDVYLNEAGEGNYRAAMIAVKQEEK